MSTRERPRTVTRQIDLDAEREVDLGTYWSSIVARWWLPLGGLAAGIVVGYLLTLGGTQVFRAQAVVYLGQPLGIQGGNQVQSINTNPSAARSIVKSESVVQTVAHDTGLSAATLRANTSANPIAGNLTKLGQNPLVAIAVKGPKPAKVRQAANELAQIVVAKLSAYSKTKLETLKKQVATDRAAVAAVTAAMGRPDISFTEKLLLQLQLAREQDDLTQAVQLKALAEDVESPRIVTRAAAQETTARSRRNSVLVGAAIGLILGVLAALVWEPLARRS